MASAADDEARVANLLRGNLSETAYEWLLAFAKAPATDRPRLGRKIIVESIIDDAEEPDDRLNFVLAESRSLLKDYATLDEPHRADIERMIRNIKEYIGDSTRKRPLNAVMSATPGAGKSHFIRQLAHAMKEQGVQAVTFNMANMQSPEDMGQPLDELRNLKMRDQNPLLFLDEFDSNDANYASLLPLLWDGELQIGPRHLKLGKVVIVLAGSKPEVAEVLHPSSEKEPTGKLVDLRSRINGGVITIPDLDLCDANRDRRVDKVCVTVTLLRQRFGEGLQQIPRSLLRFMAHTKFAYGARSIAYLIDEIDRQAFDDRALSRDLTLPVASEESLAASSVRFHLKEHGPTIVKRWRDFSDDQTIVTLKEPRPLWLYA